MLDGNNIDENSQYNGTTSSIGALNLAFLGSNINPAYIAQDITDFNVSQGGDPDIVLSDPLCTSTLTNEGIPMYVGSLREQRGQRSGSCREDVARFNFLSRDTERNSFAMAFDHTFSEAAEFYSFVNYMENEIILEGGGLNNTGGSSTTRGPTFMAAPPGAYTRNPAYGFNAIGQTLELGFFAPNIGLTRPTLADIPNAPVSLENGGTNVAGWANPRDGIPRDGVRSNFTNSESTIVQAGLRGDFTYSDRPWNYDVGVSWSQSSNEQTYQTFNRSRTELAINGLGGEGCVPNGVENFDFANQPGPFGGAVPQAWDFFEGLFTQAFFPGYVWTTRESISLALTSNNQGQGPCQF